MQSNYNNNFNIIQWNCEGIGTSKIELIGMLESEFRKHDTIYFWVHNFYLLIHMLFKLNCEREFVCILITHRVYI